MLANLIPCCSRWPEGLLSEMSRWDEGLRLDINLSFLLLALKVMQHCPTCHAAVAHRSPELCRSDVEAGSATCADSKALGRGSLLWLAPSLLLGLVLFKLVLLCLHSKIHHVVGQRLGGVWHGSILALLAAYGEEDFCLRNLLGLVCSLRQLIGLGKLQLSHVLTQISPSGICWDEALGCVGHRRCYRFEHLLLALILALWLSLQACRVLQCLGLVGLICRGSLILLVLLSSRSTLISCLRWIAPQILGVLLVILLALARNCLFQILLVTKGALVTLVHGMLNAHSCRVDGENTGLIAI